MFLQRYKGLFEERYLRSGRDIKVRTRSVRMPLLSVFVRINSQGKTLNQADLPVLTLMSVFWD